MFGSRGASAWTDCILRRIQVQKEELVSIHLVGSRLWGTCRSSSDCDLVVVTKGSRAKTAFSLAGEQKVDIMLQGEVEYNNLLEQHDFLSLVCKHIKSGHPNCLYSNLDEGRQKAQNTSSVKCGAKSSVTSKSSNTARTKKEKREQFSLAEFKLDLDALLTSVMERMTKDELKARKFFAKSDFVSGRKIFCHMVRTVLISKQIALEAINPSEIGSADGGGTTIDLEDGKELFLNILYGIKPTTFEECEHILGETRERALEELKKLTHMTSLRKR